MKKRIFVSTFLVLFVLSSFVAIANMPEKEKLGLDEIIAKNIEAHGGKEKIAGVKTVSFNIPNPRDPKVFSKIIATSDGNLKSINEVNGFTWRVTTVKDSKVQSVRYPADSSIENDEKVSFQCLALLSSGAYTVKNFEESLQFKRIKKYGPLKFYLLTADRFGHSIEFYIDAADFLLKRIIIKGGNNEEGKYQTVYEISEFQDAAGLKVPKTMITSYIGSRARNQANQTIADFKINIKPEKGFLTESKIKFGKSRFEKGVLYGECVHARAVAKRYSVIVTNIDPELIKSSELKTRDPVTVKYGSKDYDALYFASNGDIGAKDFVPGKVIVLSQFTSYAAVVFVGPQFTKIVDDFEPLTDVIIKRKTEKEKKDGKD